MVKKYFLFFLQVYNIYITWTKLVKMTILSTYKYDQILKKVVMLYTTYTPSCKWQSSKDAKYMNNAI